MNYIIVGLGAAFGGIFRYLVSNLSYKHFGSEFPYGTLIVNVIGSFLIGIFIFYFDEKELLSPQMRIFLTIGFCGGFTTFSTFSYETFALLRDSQYWFASLNALLNFFLCIFGIGFSYIIVKFLSN
ncbi:MAG: fluoride efflux transporter CrcB [Ignavibacteriaceae bacterium]